MTHRAHLPGRPARNGLPFVKPYTYRGLGYDQHTRNLNAARIAYDIEMHEGTPYTGYDTALSEVPGAIGRKPGGRP